MVTSKAMAKHLASVVASFLAGGAFLAGASG